MHFRYAITPFNNLVFSSILSVNRLLYALCIPLTSIGYNTVRTSELRLAFNLKETRLTQIDLMKSRLKCTKISQSSTASVAISEHTPWCPYNDSVICIVNTLFYVHVPPYKAHKETPLTFPLGMLWKPWKSMSDNLALLLIYPIPSRSRSLKKWKTRSTEIH